ncbi:hypothetical protein E4U52_005605 [Claviceps spartinae]|nr:hypothetical protein E4U52_005605 [Claviceps spartinae]
MLISPGTRRLCIGIKPIVRSLGGMNKLPQWTALFSTQEAFKHALDTWSAKDGLVLIAHVPGCEGHSQGERCYFSVSDLQFNQKELSVVAQGSSKHPDEITTSGETEWG